MFLREAGKLRALHASDGSNAWERPLPDKLAVQPVWDNGWLVVALFSGEVRALRATDGEVIWNRDLKSRAHAVPALAADRVYVATTDGRRRVRVEAANRSGSVVSAAHPTRSRAAAICRSTGQLVLLRDGLRRQDNWRWRTGGDVIGKPVADERYVYFVALDNVLRAMNLVSGGQQWMRPLPIRPAWGAVKAGSTIVVAGQAAAIRAYNIKDGVAAGTVTGVATEPGDAAAAAAATAPKKAQTFPPLPPDAEVAAAPHAMEHPLTRAPMLLMLFKDIVRGASLTLTGHSLEPPLVPAVATLPNLVQIAPVTPTTPPPRP